MRLRLEDDLQHSDNLLHQVRIRQRALGVAFRHRWNDIAREPLPDDIQTLLEKLDEEKKNSSKSKTSPRPKSR